MHVLLILSTLAVMLLGTACVSPQPEGTDPSGPSLTLSPTESIDPSDGSKDQAKKGFTKEVLYHLLVAELAGQRGQFSLAVSSYMNAATASQDPAIAKRATGISLLVPEPEPGLQAAALWVALDPDAMDAKQVYATLLVRTGRIDEAVPLLTALIENPDAVAEQRFFSVGELLSQGEDKQAALIAMEGIVARYPNDPQAQFALTHFLASTGDKARAIGSLERAMEMDRDNPTMQVYHAQLLHEQGKTEQAINGLFKALADGNDHKAIRTSLARLLIGVKRYQEAREQLERLVAANPDSTELRYTLTVVLFQIEATKEADKHLRRLTDQGNLTQEAYFDLARLAESQKNYQTAIDIYRKVDSSTYYLETQLRIAVILARQEKLPQAREHLHAILVENDKDTIRIYRMEAVLLANADQLDAAMSVYDTALEKYPEDSDLLYARAMLGARMGQISILERNLRDLLSREPDHADALNALGYTLADKTDRYQEAMDMIQKAMTLKPGSYYVLDSMGWVLYRMGRYQEAISYLQRALAMQQDPKVAAHLGEVLWVTGDQKAARAIWDAALQEAPEDKLLLEVVERFEKTDDQSDMSPTPDTGHEQGDRGGTQ